MGKFHLFWSFGRFCLFFADYAIFQFFMRKKVIFRLRVKFFTDMTIVADFTEGGIFRPYESPQFQVLKKTGLKFGLILKFSRNLNFRF